MKVDELVQMVGECADDNSTGMSKLDWMKVCDELATNFEMKAEAVREEMADGEGVGTF